MLESFKPYSTQRQHIREKVAKELKAQRLREKTKGYKPSSFGPLNYDPFVEIEISGDDDDELKA